MLKKVPHTYVIVFSIIVVAAILTWVVPPGKYVEKKVTVEGEERTEMVFYFEEELPESYEQESRIQTWEVFSALFKGFVRQAGIIVFILMIGGAFWIMNNSQAISVGIFSFLKFTEKLGKINFFKKLGVDNIIITLIMILFSIFGAVFGMAEETIAFIVILVPLAISMGYDSITGVSMVFVGSQLGFAGALLNPFTIGIAQGIAGLPLFSGIEYRFICWILINITGIWFVLRYVNKIRKNPASSPVYEEDDHWRSNSDVKLEETRYYTPKAAWIVYGFVLAGLSVFSFIHPVTELSFGLRSLNFSIIPVSAAVFAVAGYLTLRKSVHFFILLLLAYTILYLIVGVMGYEWYIMELATIFMAMGILSGIAMSKTANTIADLFIEGVKDIMPAAVIVGLAGGIIVVLEDGGIIDTILYTFSKAMGAFGNVASVGVMYVIQSVINIIIPSGSAKAAITMPIMAPFSDLIGISRQATVMAFQFGDGFTNMITPTSGVLIGVLGIARIPYHKWLKWISPLILILIILGFLMLIPTVTMTISGF